MFSKERTKTTRQIAKATFKAESAVVLLLEQYAFLRPKLCLLLDTHPPEQNLIDQIITISKKLPKSLERSTLIHQQLQICRELSASIDRTLKNSFQPQNKPYILYLLWKQFQDNLAARVKVNIRGKIENILSNPDSYKLLSFVRELEELTACFQLWANEQSKSKKGGKLKGNSNHNRSVELVYPKPTGKEKENRGIGTTNRDTAASTAFASVKASKHEKSSTLNDIGHDNSEHLLFRACTAKLERKELKMAVRCPSAAQLIQEQSYKQPTFEFKRASRRSKQQSMELIAEDMLDHSKHQFVAPFGAFKMSKFRHKESIRFSKRIMFDQEQLNVSFLNKNFEEKNGHPESKINIVSIKAIENDEEDEMFGEEGKLKKNDDQDSEIIFLERSQCRKASKYSAKRAVESSLESSQIKTPEGSFEEEEMEFKIKKKLKKVAYQKVRRSGKFLIKQNDTWVDVSALSQKKSRHGKPTSRRRIAVMPPNGDSFGELKNGIPNEEQLAHEKRIEFEDNVFLAVADVLKSNKNIKTKRPQTAKKPKPTTFSAIMSDLKGFLQQKPFQAQNECGSVFFNQQQKIRKSQDEAMKQRIHMLMKHNKHSSNIFEMGYRSTSNKDIIFNQFHRNECFKSDQEWIKHTINANSELLQKPI